MPLHFHPYSWLLWLAAGATAALMTQNPFYLVIVLLSAGFVYAVLVRRQRLVGSPDGALNQPAAWRSVIKLALLLWVFTILFNGLTVHLGPTTVFTLPRSWPLVGGPITLEAIIYGFVSGLSFVTLILLFATFNSAVGPQTLLRMVPGFAYQAGVAITISLSFIPQTIIVWQEIREAQRLRGYRVRGLRDMRPLFVSLLATGMDRAIQLAESMDSRGFGGQPLPISRQARRLIAVGVVSSLLLLLGGLLMRTLTRSGHPLGWLALVAGSCLLLLCLYLQGKRVQRTRYRRWQWFPRDTVATAASAIVLLVYLSSALLFPDLLFYYPYPPFSPVPSFQPLIGLLTGLLITPALLLPPAIVEFEPLSSS